MGECHRCGECCRVIPVRVKGNAPETIAWLKARGAYYGPRREYLLIPHVCPQLKDDPDNPGKTLCSIHGTDQYPITCARYHGFGRYYMPPGCGYLQEK